jgi:tRNA A37 methylthiotransferase MiaB
MAGQVPEPVRRERAAELLALAAARRAAFAADQVGTATRVLFEQRTPSGAWVGHGDRHVLVEATPRHGGSLDNVIARVAVVGRGSAPDRVRGELEAVHAQ